MKKSIIPFVILMMLLVGCESIVRTPAVKQTGNHVQTDSGLPVTDDQEATYPPEPQTLSILTADGVELPATFYPAAVESAPIIVLFHWISGDQTDWAEIAPWLQNRSQGGQGNARHPWVDASWFPAAPTGMAYAVLTVSFRGCDATGCKARDMPHWLLDAQAAMKKASEMEGIDKTRIISMGASIGADGAADGCIWLNQKFVDAHCVGTLGFSAGSYLAVPYGRVVADLNSTNPAAIAWCVYGSPDSESASACKSIKESNYRALESGLLTHGMEFFAPEISPSMFEVMQDFLETALK